MTHTSAVDKAWRAYEFARHMPASKLLRRIELNIRRQLRDRAVLPERVSRPEPARSSRPPAPIFSPRADRAPKREGDGWRFEFLCRAVAMAGSRVDWSAPGSGAADQLWRMNLHYMEYLEGVDDTAWSALVDNWIASNPARQPRVWRDSWNSYALSLRVLVWLQELARRGDLAEVVRKAAETSAAAQLRFLENNLETDLGGNHLFKNIKALLWASTYYAGPEAEHWRRLSLRSLDGELDTQIFADGVHYEKSPAYHCQVFADLLECRHALGYDAFGGRLDDALRRMAQATADLSHPDGRVALFNDAGLTMSYSPRECLDVYEGLFGSRPTPRAVFAFPEAGYFGLRREGTYLLVDCGRIAPDDLPAHGHGDVLSFEWSVGGERMIVDQGVFEYVEGTKRDLARTAMSHNTLCFEGADQADFFGAFRCGRRPNVAVRRWEPSACGFLLEGTHDGFGNLPGAPKHVRCVTGDVATLEIVDRIEGDADRTARINFLLHPDVGAEAQAERIKLSCGGVTAVFESSAPAELQPAVWWPDMGQEMQTNRIVVPMSPTQKEVRTSFRIVSRE